MPRPQPATSAVFRLRQGAWVALVLALAPGPARAQNDGSSGTAGQLWVSAYLGKRFSVRTYGRLDIEPQWQVSSGDAWRSLDVTPRLECYPLEWLDLVAETEVGATVQSNDQDSLEIAPRVGVTLHVLSKVSPLRGDVLHHEPRLPLTRLHVSTLVRLEWRNMFYSDGTPDSHEWRARFRPGVSFAINHDALALERTLYAYADAEYFLPIAGDVSERYVNKIRIRAGLGYRVSEATRLELLLVRDWNRSSPDSVRSEDVRALDVRVTHAF